MSSLSDVGTSADRRADLQLPSVHRVADHLATMRQRRYTRLVVVELGATVTAALVSQGGTLLREQAIGFEVASAACLAMAIGAQLLSQRTGWNRDWLEDRAVAEASVTASWRYMARIAPFDADEAAEERFASVLMTDIPRGSRTLSSEILGLGRRAFEATPAMRQVREAPWAERARLYAERRLAGQRQWYVAKADYNRRRERVFSLATIAANLLAGAFVVLRLLNPSINLIGIFTTLASSLIAWTNSRRFHELRESYAAVGGELTDLEGQLAGVQQEEEFLQVAVAAEETITREHSVWIVRRVPRHPGRPRL